MSAEHRATYLNDHLAGAVAAIDLLERLESSFADTEKAREFAALRDDIASDRDELKALMQRLQVEESGTRKATAWLSSRMAELKLRWDDRGGGPLRFLEITEAVSLGIAGKLALWRSLSAAAEVAPALRAVDYDRLVERAEEQRRRIEALRLEAARAALAE